MTLEKFVETYKYSALDDEKFAEAVVRHLPEDMPLVRVSRAFLDACKAFDAAVVAAGFHDD